MDYSVIPPCEELKNSIKFFWVATWNPENNMPNSTYYVIANNLTEISFGFKSENKHSELLFSTVQGHTYEPTQYSVSEYDHLLGVSFYSHAIPHIFQIPALELNKEFISLHAFLGNDGTHLNERIALATSTNERIAILADYFKSRIIRQPMEDKLINHAIREIKYSVGNIKINELAQHYSLSQKQFNRRFKELSGFNPKMFARITRLENLIQNYSSWESLTEAAHANGYHDQAHLNHEFKALTGFNPKRFWALIK